MLRGVGSGQAPSRDVRVQGVPPFGGRHGDPKSLSNGQQTHGFQHPDSFPDDGPRNTEEEGGIISADAMTRRQRTGDDIRAPALDDRVMKH